MPQSLLDDGCHIVILILGQAATEDDAGFGIGQGLVLLVEGGVCFVIHGIEGLAAFGPFGGVFAGDDGNGLGVDGISEVFEMLVLDDAGVGDVALGVVHHSATLVVGGIEHLVLEGNGAVFELAEAVAIELINLAGEDDFIGQGFPVLTAGEEILVHAAVNTRQQRLGELVVAADGYALVGIVEVVVIIHQAHGEAADDEGGQLGAGAAPLFFGIAFDEFFVNITPHEAEGLLLQVARLGNPLLCHGGGHLLPLFINPGLRFCGGGDAPHLVEGVHVERQVVALTFIFGHGAVGVAVEGDEGIDKVPHLLVGGVEDMRPILVNIDAVALLAIDIAAELRPLVDNQAAFAGAGGHVGKDSAEKPAAHNEIIVVFFLVHPVKK